MTPLPRGKTLWRVVESRCHDARKTKTLAVGIENDDFGHAYIVLKVPKTRTVRRIMVDTLHDMIVKADARR